MPKWDIWLCENCGKVFHTHLSATSQCPKCGAYKIVAAYYKAVPLRERFKENKKEAAPFIPERFEDSTVILGDERIKMERCSNCGAAFQQWIRPEPQNPYTIAMLKSIEVLGTVAGHHPPHVCPNCKHYWWFYENQMEDKQWPEDW